MATPPSASISSASALSLSILRPSRATFAPARAKALAKMEQRVPLAPVTTATLPDRSVFRTFFSTRILLF